MLLTDHKLYASHLQKCFGNIYILIVVDLLCTYFLKNINIIALTCQDATYIPI
jgi:hypothetical protein